MRPITLLLALLVAHPMAAAESRPPDILYILVDDMGYADCGFNGGKEIETPHIDALAKRGAIFENYYVQPVCSATRACFMTGRLPHRHGIAGALKTEDEGGLPLQERTLAEALRESGYSTAITGKWHLGESEPAYRPTRRGFDHQHGLWYGMHDHFTLERGGRKDWYRNDEPIDETGYSTHLITDEACRIIQREDRRKPLFLYVSYTAVHSPFQVPDSYLEPYHTLPKPRRKVAGMLAAIDEGVGKIVAALESSGRRDHTLIVFSSDNGGVHAGVRTDNRPLRGQKGTPYDGGFRSSAFVNWPDRIEAGSRIGDITHIADWYPTFLHLAGGSVKQDLPLDGLNLWPRLSQGTPIGRDAILLVGTDNRSTALRVGDWKLILTRSRVELYNLAEDLPERRNLADTHPDKVREMKLQLEKLRMDKK